MVRANGLLYTFNFRVFFEMKSFIERRCSRMRWWRHANCTFSSSSLLARVPPAAGKDIASFAPSGRRRRYSKQCRNCRQKSFSITWIDRVVHYRNYCEKCANHLGAKSNNLFLFKSFPNNIPYTFLISYEQIKLFRDYFFVIKDTVWSSFIGNFFKG